MRAFFFHPHSIERTVQQYQVMTLMFYSRKTTVKVLISTKNHVHTRIISFYTNVVHIIDFYNMFQMWYNLISWAVKKIHSTADPSRTPFWWDGPHWGRRWKKLSQKRMVVRDVLKFFIIHQFYMFDCPKDQP